MTVSAEPVDPDDVDEDLSDDSVWARLDRRLSSRPARLTSVAIAVIALALAIGVGVQQVRLTSCLSSYNDSSARSTAARAQAAAEDRKADDADRLATDGERQAFLSLLESIQSGDQAKEKVAFINLAAAYQAGDTSRAATAKTRADNERKRAENPVPPPPSLKCG